jgi:putative sigma-54 modulation protein
MRLDITGRHVEITAPLQQLIEKRLARLDRLLNDSAMSATVILTKEKYRHRTELIVHARGDHTMRGLGEGNAWPISLRQAAEKVEQQAQKLKGKWAERKRSSTRRRTPRAAATVEAPPASPRVVRTATTGDGTAAAPKVVRASRYPVRPMSVEDAALRVQEGPDTFIVFRNADTDAVSILYRRKDGNLGLIEPD